MPMTDTTHAAIDAMVAPLRRIAFWLPALWPDRMANMIQALAAERDAPDFASMLVIAAADMIVATRDPRVWAALTQARKETP